MPIPDHIQQAIQAYYAERANDDDIAALEQWFREDEANIRLFAELGMAEWQLLNEHEKQDAAAIMTLLRESEDDAEPDFSLLHTSSFEVPPTKLVKPTITAGELLSLAGYLTAKGLRTRAGIIGSIAAVLVLGAVLYITLIGFGTTPGSPGVADGTPTSPVKVPTQTVVATLTAEHNAVWSADSAEGALAPGSLLRAGQRI